MVVGGHEEEFTCLIKASASPLSNAALRHTSGSLLTQAKGVLDGLSRAGCHVGCLLGHGLALLAGAGAGA